VALNWDSSSGFKAARVADGQLIPTAGDVVDGVLIGPAPCVQDHDGQRVAEPTHAHSMRVLTVPIGTPKSPAISRCV